MPECLEPGVDKVGELGRGWVAQGFMHSVSVGSLSFNLGEVGDTESFNK